MLDFRSHRRLVLIQFAYFVNQDEQKRENSYSQIAQSRHTAYISTAFACFSLMV